MAKVEHLDLSESPVSQLVERFGEFEVPNVLLTFGTVFRSFLTVFPLATGVTKNNLPRLWQLLSRTWIQAIDKAFVPGRIAIVEIIPSQFVAILAAGRLCRLGRLQRSRCCRRKGVGRRHRFRSYDGFARPWLW
jgi:hypothetical protein